MADEQALRAIHPCLNPLDRDSDDDLLMDGGQAPRPGLIVTTPELEQIAELRGDQYGFEDKTGFGWATTSLPDLNWDGVPELALSAPWAMDKAGRRTGMVLILSGDGGEELQRLSGFDEDRAFGSSLIAIGNERLAVAAPGTEDWGGAVYVFNLVDGLLEAIHEGGEPGDRFGAALETMDDLNGDEVPELLVGAPGADGAETDTGAVYAIFSQSELMRIAEGAQPGDRFGEVVVAAGDVDGDGLVELLVGAPGAARTPLDALVGAESEPEVGEVALPAPASRVSSGLDGATRCELMVRRPASSLVRTKARRWAVTWGWDRPSTKRGRRSRCWSSRPFGSRAKGWADRAFSNAIGRSSRAQAIFSADQAKAPRRWRSRCQL